jgi:hypothetical protein
MADIDNLGCVLKFYKDMINFFLDLKVCSMAHFVVELHILQTM